MGGLRPIGSEKLSGMDKIRRIMEIATYDGNKGSNLNEDKENVFSVKLADNIDYVIVKEKQGYIIKESFNGEINYLENIQERKYYKSYSQALKRLNLVAKEKNTLYENKKGTALFEESEKKKFYLNLGDKKKDETNSEAPAVATTPPPTTGATSPTPPPTTGATSPTPPPTTGATSPTPLAEQGDPTIDPNAQVTPPLPIPTGSETPTDPTLIPPIPDVGLEGGEGMKPEEDMGIEPEEGGEDKKEEITFKLIQKLTGKLAQKLRSYGEDKEMSSDNIKYVINSIISAIDVEALDEDDIEEIMNRLEGEEEDEDMEDEMDMESEEEPMGGMGPEPGLEGPPPAPSGAVAQPEGEMAEGFKNLSDAFVNKFKGAYTNVLNSKLKSESDRKNRRRKKHSYSDNSEIFGESTVDKIISSYFNIKEDEYLIKEESSRKEIEFIKRKNTQEIKRLSESLRQERMALKFIEKYPKAKLLGSTTKKNLVFKQGLIERKITPEGKVL